MGEAMYPDGSTFGNGIVAPAPGHDPDTGLSIAMNRMRLITARSALEVYIRYEGRMQVTRNGHRMAVINVIEPLSGKTFSTPSGKVTMKSCRDALAECNRLLNEIDATAIVYDGSES